jgi:acyl-CoA reductase-like NAD-dependent aldehyde dehydrogenase
LTDSGTEIKDPATGEVIGRVAFGTPDDVAPAVDAATAAQRDWAALGDQERRAALIRAADAIVGRRREQGWTWDAMSAESGQPRPGCADAPRGRNPRVTGRNA